MYHDTKKVGLTGWQAEYLKPLLDQAADAYNMDRAGMVVAQVWEDTEGGAFMTVGFVDSKAASQIQDAMGITPENRGASGKPIDNIVYFVDEGPDVGP